MNLWVLTGLQADADAIPAFPKTIRSRSQEICFLPEQPVCFEDLSWGEKSCSRWEDVGSSPRGAEERIIYLASFVDI